eukprot:1544449-Prymnesium_polylepis.1
MMQHLARSSFTVGSYTEPYQPHLFGVPESEEEALPYAAFQGALSPPPPPSALFLRHPLGLILGTSAAPLAPLLGQPSAGDAGNPWGMGAVPSGQEPPAPPRTDAQIAEINIALPTASVVGWQSMRARCFGGRVPLTFPVSVWTMAPDATVLVALRRQSSF